MARLATVVSCLFITLTIFTVVPVWAATWNVPGDGTNTCTIASPSCNTIQAAINASSLGDTITVAAGTFTENLSINHGLTIIGAGDGITIIDGGTSGTVITHPPILGAVSISEVTIQNGNRATGDGGGIWNGGELTLTNVTITSNSAPQGSGGGIYNVGPLTLTNATVKGNSAGGCGGIFNHAGLTLSNVKVSGNSAVTGGGGGICHEGVGGFPITATMSNVVINGNSANLSNPFSFGGGIAITSAAILIISHSTISGNSAALGGAIASASPSGALNNLILTDVTLSNNSATQQGGALYNEFGSSLRLYNATISSNSASVDGGGIFNDGDATLVDVTISDNSADFGGGSSPGAATYGYRTASWLTALRAITVLTKVL